VQVCEAGGLKTAYSESRQYTGAEKILKVSRAPEIYVYGQTGEEDLLSIDHNLALILLGLPAIHRPETDIALDRRIPTSSVCQQFE
jgi:hypothetical protein